MRATRGEATDGAGLRVLQSFREPRATTNPYLVQLRNSLAAQATVIPFSWRAGLLGGFDVFHVHWPEVVVERRSRVRRWAASVGFALVLWRASTRGRVLVRTLHNLQPHEPPDRLTRSVIGACDRRTTWWIRLNERTPAPDPGRCTTVLHGDYTAWFARHRREAAVPGRIVYVGLVRPYKGVEDLVAAFAGVPDPDSSLVVAGRPSSPEVEASLRDLAGADARIMLDLRYVEDADLVRYLTAAELVVLPYRHMHNSGAALLALSLGRPVLVPRNEVNTDLAREVGNVWVQRYDGALTPTALAESLAAVRGAEGAPDLSLRRWPAVAAGHLEAYRHALAARHDVEPGAGARR